MAVGVVDILPSSLSSVYFFYDPSYHHLSLGVWSALQEIAWVQRFSLTHPSCVNYVMGFYIHSCPKMRYKAQFFPTQVLCPVRYTWHALDACIPYLEAHKYVVFSDVVPLFVPPQQQSVERGGAAKKRAKQPTNAAAPSPSMDTSSASSVSTARDPVSVGPQGYTVSPSTVAEEKRTKSAHSTHLHHVSPQTDKALMVVYVVRAVAVVTSAGVCGWECVVRVTQCCVGEVGAASSAAEVSAERHRLSGQPHTTTIVCAHRLLALQSLALPRILSHSLLHCGDVQAIAPRATARFRSLMAEYTALMGEEVCLAAPLQPHSPAPSASVALQMTHLPLPSVLL